MNKLSGDTMCILPFIHMNSNPSGEVFLCCVSSRESGGLDQLGDVNENTLEEIFIRDKGKSGS